MTRLKCATIRSDFNLRRNAEKVICNIQKYQTAVLVFSATLLVLVSTNLLIHIYTL